MAYVNGQRISDRDAVMKLMFADLNEMEEASNCIEASITNELHEIADIMGQLE